MSRPSYAPLIGDEIERTLRGEFGHILKHHGIIDGVVLADLVACARAHVLNASSLTEIERLNAQEGV